MEDDKVNIVSISTQKFKCTKGHHFEGEYGMLGPWTIRLGPDLSIDALCPLCLKETLEKLLVDVGRVQEDNGTD